MTLPAVGGEINLQITQADLNGAEIVDAFKCPIALALNRQFSGTGRWGVDASAARYYPRRRYGVPLGQGSTLVGISLRLSQEAVNFLVDWDAASVGRPCTLRITRER